MTAVPRYIFGSLTRISDLDRKPFVVTPQPRSAWGTGDYVVGEVTSWPGPLTHVELVRGRMVEVVPGDLVVGALGKRLATLEAVGSWEDVGQDLEMDALTSAGLFGKVTSRSALLPPLLSLRYMGHATREGRILRMQQFAPTQVMAEYAMPTILLIGTSMSSGKTTSARVIVRRLTRAGLRVAGAKLTGAGRYRDVLSMGDSGAATIHDFVDVGLPSSVCDKVAFRKSLDILLGLIAVEGPDVVVAESGASPIEDYNGEAAMAALAGHVCCTVLCASDPYAVVGVMEGFGIIPDLIAGIATTTSAGVELIRRLTGLPALNLLKPEAVGELDEILASKVPGFGTQA